MGFFFSFLPEWLDMLLSLAVIVVVPVIVVVLFVAMWRKTFMTIWYFISFQPLRRWLLRKRVSRDLEYYRDLPADGNLKVAAAVVNSLSSNIIADYTGLFGALFLRLINDGVLMLEERSSFHGVEPHGVIVVGDWPQEKAKTGINALEWHFYAMLCGAAGRDGILQPRELQQFMRSDAEEFKTFMSDVGNLTPDEKRMAGNWRVVHQVMGLRKFLLDYSLIGEREIREVPLWKEYLVYATLYGIADKVCENFSEVYSDYFNMNQLAGTMLHLVGNRSLLGYSNAVAGGLRKVKSKK